ncbi:putative glycosidase C21B10.07 [Grifola frondosa]|uniref:Putative glycosidase C21B10.07 n=1 Tax=Grifola frondosa TaxID=5627 RepID=A0A1C7M3N6_GRIFR|nr:putative glycosidase C21B10.07 [Grifola frondosa]
MICSAVLVGVAALLPALVEGQYVMVKEYAGESFFDDWNFFNAPDNLTHGNTNNIDAFHDNLAFVNDAGNAIMQVDNTTTLKFNQNRNSIRISSKDQFTVGTVFVADMLHVPYGCSVWGAWWSSAPTWPLGGEIDTFEAVNQVTMSHMGLHTNPGCTHSPSAVQSSTLINSTDCSIYANSNEGCTVTNPSTSSYGAGADAFNILSADRLIHDRYAEFANNGGGMFVTEFAIEGISLTGLRSVFLELTLSGPQRSSIPSSMQGNVSTVDTTTLGIPVANWPASDCSINQFFDPQELVFDITLCGDFAGNPTIFAETCTGVCYDDWVLGDPSRYSTAYFEVSYVRVYGIAGELTVLSSNAHRSAEPRWASLFTLAVGILIGMVVSL